MSAALRAVSVSRPHRRVAVVERVRNLRQICAGNAGETQDRYHKQHKSACYGTNGGRISAQVPRTRSEAVSDKEDADEDGDGERAVLCQSDTANTLNVLALT